MVFTQLVAEESLSRDSFLLAAFPAIFISFGLWFNFVNQTYS